jgi:hypothetical protein
VEAQPASKLASIEPTSARRHARVRVLLSAKLVTTTEETNVKIRDVSLSGAMLQGRSLPRVGSDAIVSRGSFEIFTTVIWRRDDLCGVQFDTPLSCFEELLEAGTTHASMVGLSRCRVTGPWRQATTRWKIAWRLRELGRFQLAGRPSWIEA